ncbi:AsmA-like C-terminal domain-containing protein, partial [Thermodesulfobacteriota bacterium]
LGREQEIRSLKGTIGGNAFELEGKMTQEEGFGLTFQCSSPYLDMEKLFLKPDSQEAEEVEPATAGSPASMEVGIEGDIYADRGTFREIEFEPMNAKLLMDRGVFRTDVTADFDGGGLTGCAWVNTLHAEGRRFGLCLSASGMDLGALLRSLGSEESIIEGRGDVTGTLEGLSVKGEPLARTLNGRVEIVTGEGVLKRLEVLSRILTLVDASKWFTMMPGDLTAEGMPCRRISGSFEIVDGIASTEDLVLEANAMRLSAVGSIDLAKRTMDMTVGFQPLGNFDAVVDQLPIVGHILTGEGHSLIVFAFRLEGSIEEPRIRPVSLESVGRGMVGILGRLLQLPLDLVDGSFLP